MPEQTFELIAGDTGPCLKIDLGDHGSFLHKLDEVERYKLARIGMTLADDTPHEPLLPPYVIGAALIYTDSDPDRTAHHYTWAARTNDRTLADSIRDAASRELARTAAFNAFQAFLYVFPEQEQYVGQLTNCTTVEAGIARDPSRRVRVLDGLRLRPLGDLRDVRRVPLRPL